MKRPLRDREAQRLLAVDVFLRPGSGDGLQSMPVIRRGDLHSIDISPREHLAEVLVRGAALRVIGLIDEPLRGFAAERAGLFDDAFVVAV